MLRKKSAVIAVAILLLTAGCSGPTQQFNNTQTSSTTESTTTFKTPNNKTSYENNSKGNKNYTKKFISHLNSSPVNVTFIDRYKRTLQVRYTGNFRNRSRTTSETIYIITKFSNLVNTSYHDRKNWNVTRLNIVGSAPNGSVVWDARTEDWWAMK